ncbi:MAG: hypothetical protein C5B51_17985 [Terriglobia bacterium]|nr:MAG: hypothetical protein C5B51_17985 [Terriglobia bacterium]
MNSAPAAPARALRTAGYWIFPSLLCLVLYWRGFRAWFRADDFAWLGAGLDVHSAGDLLRLLFTPAAQGTIRPWSETGLFPLSYRLFGLHAAPLHVLIFGTQFVNLALVASIGTRLTGVAAAGFWAAVLWVINGSLVEPLGWACTYNQVLCGFCLLLAFHFLLRYIETGRRRDYVWQWVVFLAGFGALEINLVYPLLAAGYTFLCARKYLSRTLPLFAVSLVYVVGHLMAAPNPKTGAYAMHFTPEILGTLAAYWSWSVGPTYTWTPFRWPGWVLPLGIGIVTLSLALFLARKLRRSERAALFCLLWFVAAIAPVLPLRDHMTEYYVFLPVIGLCWLGAWGLVEAWRSGWGAKLLAVLAALSYAVMGLPEGIAGSKWNYNLTVRARGVVEGVARAHELYPRKTILLDGVDTDLFWNTFPYQPFRLVGAENVYLTPGSEERIEARPESGDVRRYVLPENVTHDALDRGDLVVYDARGPRLRNVTSLYAAIPRERKAPSRVDAAIPLNAYLLGPEWYRVDEDHRWMPQRATLAMAAPERRGERLWLRGGTSPELLRNGAVTVAVSVNGIALSPARIASGEESFELSFPLPDALVGAPKMQVAVTVDRTFHAPPDPREFGLYFGVFEVR